jgi:uncharacterized repeat protein (TIGR01451 family)
VIIAACERRTVLKHHSPTSRANLYIQLLGLIAMLAAALAIAAPRSAAAAAPAQLDLEFDGSDNAGTLNSFLATSLPGTSAPNGGASVHTAAPGTLQIVTTAGDLLPFGTGQDNALAYQYDSAGAYTIGARLLKPTFAAPFQSAGIYIGKAGNQYIRFTAGKGSKGSNGERLELDVLESNGKLRTSTIALAPGTFASINSSLDLFLNIDHAGSGKITALYRIDSDDPNAGRLATSRSFPRWLRQGGAVAVSAGVISTSRGTFTPNTISYDWFRITATAQATAAVIGTKTVDKDGVSGPGVNPGDTLTYTISVTNNSATTSVQVADPMPVDTSYVAGSATGGATFDAASNRIVWQNGSLGAGATTSFSYKVQINQAPLQSSTIVNTAALTYGASTVPALLSAATTVGITPDLSDSTYTANPGLVGPNGTVTYTLNLLNDGTAAASGASAQLAVPTGTVLVAGSASASSGSLSIDPSLTKITWSAAGPLAIGGTATITFTTNVGSAFANGAPIASQAIIQASGALPVLATAQSIYAVAAAVVGTKTVDKAVADPGATLTYLITVSNTSGAAASDVQVADPIPQDTSYVGNLSASAGVPTYDSGANQVLWQIPTLAASQSITMSFQVQINQLPLHSASITNRATLIVPGAPQSLLSAVTSVRGVADLSHSIYTADPLVVGPNGTITYALDLLNDGTTAASNASATLTIPAGSSLVANSAAATSGSLNVNTALNTITWTAGAPLTIGAVTRISFQVKLGITTVNSILSSTATLQADGFVPNAKIAQARFSPSQLQAQYVYLAAIRR